MLVATIKYLLTWASAKLRKTSASPALDSEVLLSFILKKTKEYLFANPNKRLSKLEISRYRNLISTRLRFWPVAYLVGHKEFFGLDFKVTKDVLIPRPETETLIERALTILQSEIYNLKSIIDLGTGSGNIIISLIKSLPPLLTRGGWAADWRTGRGLKFFALDFSRKALRIARANARRHGVSNKIKFLHGHLLSPILDSKFKTPNSSLILANLPYLTPKQVRSNPDLKHEPRSALVGGQDGLKYFRNLFRQLVASFPSPGLRPPSPSGRGAGVRILLEHDPSQKPALTNLAKKHFPSAAKIQFHKDLAGKYRIFELILR